MGELWRASSITLMAFSQKARLVKVEFKSGACLELVVLAEVESNSLLRKMFLQKKKQARHNN